MHGRLSVVWRMRRRRRGIGTRESASLNGEGEDISVLVFRQCDSVYELLWRMVGVLGVLRLRGAAQLVLCWWLVENHDVRLLPKKRLASSFSQVSQ
jgi:hypothetical protein